MLVDSHCHLNLLSLDPPLSIETYLEAAAAVGVETLLNVSIDLETAPLVINTAKQHARVYASVGLHPSHELPNEPTVDDYCQLAMDLKVIAIGETGLDYYYSSHREVMQERFRRHIRAAIKLNKPLIIHTRDARDDTLRIMQEEGADKIGGVMHCFTDTLEMARAAMAMGFYISFSGIVTFNKAKNVVDVARKIPLDRLLIETDAPYLAPVPYRGKPNQPAYVREVAMRLAELHGVSVEILAKHSTDNFYHLFSLASRP